MYLPNSGGQSGQHRSYRADGTIGNTSPKLILPEGTSRAFLSVQNIGTNPIYLEHGCARATATITNGAVTSIAVLNGGFGFTRPPIVQFKGGGSGSGNLLAPLTASNWDGRGQIDRWPQPSGTVISGTNTPTYNQAAQGVAVLTSGVVTSITILSGGSGYTNPPEIVLTNDPNDPFGCADPSKNSGSGAYLFGSGGTYFLNGTFCHTDAIALYCPAGSATYMVEYAP